MRVKLNKEHQLFRLLADNEEHCMRELNAITYRYGSYFNEWRKRGIMVLTIIPTQIGPTRTCRGICRHGHYHYQLLTDPKEVNPSTLRLKTVERLLQCTNGDRRRSEAFSGRRGISTLPRRKKSLSGRERPKKRDSGNRS